MKTLCVIPVYNEYNKLINLIDQLKKNKHKEYNLQYLFINNGSTDGSHRLILNSKYNFLNLKTNKGVGFALILGFLYAKKYNYNYIIHLAGNGKMKPIEINKIIYPILKDDYDFVSGSRYLYGGSNKNNPIHRTILIKLFSLIISILLKKRITDASCGFRAFKVKIYKNFKKNFLKEELFTYGYEYFSIGKVLKDKNVKFTEVPVGMDYPLTKDYSKIRPFLDWIIIAKYWLKGILDKSEL